MKIYEIGENLIGEWNSEVKAIIDTWNSYFHVTLQQFKIAIFDKGIKFAKSNNGQAWIVDNSNAKGVFAQDIQKYLEQEGFKILKDNGIKYFITINSAIDPLTKMTTNRYKANASKSGLKQLELHSVADAILWLKTNA